MNAFRQYLLSFLTIGVSTFCWVGSSLVSAQYYAVDMDVGTEGIQTSKAVGIGDGPFSVDLYWISPGPDDTNAMSFDAFGVALEFNEAATCPSAPVLALEGPPILDPVPALTSICDEEWTNCTSTSIDLSTNAVALKGQALGTFGFSACASRSFGQYCASNGGAGLYTPGYPFFSGGTNIPPAGTAVQLYRQTFRPVTDGLSRIEPVGIFRCPQNPDLEGDRCRATSTPWNPMPAPLAVAEPITWPDVAELYYAGWSIPTRAGELDVNPEPAYCSGPICWGEVTVGLLPVELVSFDGLVDDNQVTLVWKTASESNNAGFEVQQLRKSESQLPLEDWVPVGFVASRGSVDGGQRYTYSVTDLPPGVTSFRLKKLDLDGVQTYSKSIEVRTDLPSSHILEAAYPNPFTDKTRLTLVVREAQQVTVDVFDLTGRHISSLFNGYLQANQKERLTFDGAGHPGGTYVYRACGQFFSETKKMVLLR